MRPFLHCVVVLVVLQIVASSQNPYSNQNFPPSYPMQQGQDGAIPQNELDRRVPQQSIQQPYQGQRAPNTQQTSEFDQQHHSNQQQQQQYQYMMQQQRPIYPPTGYIPGRTQQETQGPGLFSKLKNSLFAAGSAISDSLSLSSLDGTPVNTPSGQGYYANSGNSGYTNTDNKYNNRGQVYNTQRYDTTSSTSSGNSNSNVGGSGNSNSGTSVYENRDPRGVPKSREEGLVGRFKSIFGLDEATSTDTSNYGSGVGSSSGGNSGSYRPVFPNAPVGRPLPPHLVQQQIDASTGTTVYGSSGASGVGGSNVGISSGNVYGQYPAYPSGNSGSGNDHHTPPYAGSVGGISTTPVTSANSGTGGVSSGTSGVYDTPTADSISNSLDTPNPSYNTYTTPTTLSTTTGNTGTTISTSTTGIDNIQTLVPPEPQVFIHDGSIILILKPREFARKKALFTSAGSEKIQMFSDFEHVFTSFNTYNERTLTSAELLETSGIINEYTLQQLSQLADEFEVSNDNIDYTAFEMLSAKCQNVLCKDGGLPISAVPQVTRALSSRLGLRSGWSDTLHTLASTGVPTYLFSSGYGDVVTQALLQGLYPNTSPSPNTPPLPLPQNLRVISNFFRAAPDGTVRAFSQPIVHERNKNATTASAHMGMEVLSRPYAIVLGSHEDDVHMTQGVQGLQEQISVGYLELSEDLGQRLPLYLSTFDAVVVGDGNLQYVHKLLQDILQLPHSSSRAPRSSANGGILGTGINLSSGIGSGLGSVSSAGQGIAQGLRNRIGALLSSGTTQPQYTPPQYNVHTVQGVQGVQGQYYNPQQGQYAPTQATHQQYQHTPQQVHTPHNTYQGQPMHGQYSENVNSGSTSGGGSVGSSTGSGVGSYGAVSGTGGVSGSVSSGSGTSNSGSSSGYGSGVENNSPAYLDFNEYQ